MPFAFLKAWVTRVALVAAAVPVLVDRTSAQVRRPRETALVLGAYLPTGQWPLQSPMSLVCYIDPTNPYDCLPESMSPKTTIVVGTRITWWLSKGAGVEGSLSYSPSGFRHVVGGTSIDGDDVDSGIFLADLRSVFAVVPEAQTSVLFMGGLALIGRVHYPVSPGGVIGVAVDWGHAKLRPAIEDHLYAVDGDFKQDFTISLAVNVRAQPKERR